VGVGVGVGVGEGAGKSWLICAIEMELPSLNMSSLTSLMGEPLTKWLGNMIELA
jgi:hypothetical protein